MADKYLNTEVRDAVGRLIENRDFGLVCSTYMTILEEALRDADGAEAVLSAHKEYAMFRDFVEYLKTTAPRGK